MNHKWIENYTFQNLLSHPSNGHLYPMPNNHFILQPLDEWLKSIENIVLQFHIDFMICVTRQMVCVRNMSCIRSSIGIGVELDFYISIQYN